MSKYILVENRGKVVLPGLMASVNAYLERIRFVEIINDKVVWDPVQWDLSPGVLLKALVLNTFSNTRAPLYKIAESYKDIDTERLFGKGVTPDQLTDSATGAALERIYEANAENLLQTLILTVFKKYEIPIKRLHSDTTSLSFYGSYENDQTDEIMTEAEVDKETIHITYGHNKDRRPDCKQAVLGQISNEDGIMLCSHAMDGNTSDVTWNREALKFVKYIQNELETGHAIYVADCKLMTKKLFLSMIEDEILFLSRVPAHFASKVESQVREEAYKKGDWQDIGKISTGKKACIYEIQQFRKEVYGQSIRLIVVKSSASLASFEASRKKRKKQIDDTIKKLNKKVFACKTDALRDWEDFCKKYKKEPYIFSMQLLEQKTEKRPRGNPGKNPKPPKIITEWTLKIETKVDEQKLELLRKKAESFVLISNVAESSLTPKNLLEIYKGQVVVELNFKAIKSPTLLSNVFLKKEERIEAMIMIVISVALMIRALILYHLRKGLKESGESPRIGYSGTALKNVTMGLFEYAMNSIIMERQDDGIYHIFINPKQHLRVMKFLSYLNLDFNDLT